MIKNKYYKLEKSIINAPLLLCLLGMLFFSKSYSQDDCATILSKAQKLYNEGIIEQIPQMLAPCIKDGFTSEERIQAQKLIILSALFNNNVTEAESEILHFLKKNPEYPIASNDPAEFVNLYNKYVTDPNAYIGIIIGAVSPKVQADKLYGVFNQNKIKGVYSSPTPGFMGGLKFGYLMTSTMDGFVEAIYSQYGFQYKVENVVDNATVKSVESFKQFSLPISMTYSRLKFNNIKPYVRLGVVPTYLVSVTQLLEKSSINLSVKPLTSSENDITENRNQFIVSGLVGAGVKYKIPRGIITLELDYTIGMMNVVKQKQFENPENQLLYNYSDNDYRLSSLQVSLGYSYILYKPRKKKNQN